MEQINQKNTPATKTKSQDNDFIAQIKYFLSKLTKKDKIAYGLIAVGVIFIVVGIILW